MLNRTTIALAALALAGASSSALAARTNPTKKAAAPQARAASVVSPSETVSQLAYWVIASGDNNGLPFMVIDKVAAGVWVFDARGMFMGSAPALVGITRGDESEPGVGDRELSDIPPDQRTTPAGRFVASFGRAAGGRKVLWVDYHTGISLHAVVTHNRKEHRLERLKSPTPDDNRISFGCINVPPAFYKNVVKTIFKTAHGIVYILPETKSVAEVFPAFRPQIPAVQSAVAHPDG